MKLEICIDSVESAVNAQLGGADRVELCDSLVEGGTTPSYGVVKSCRERLNKTKLHIIIRPRGGDFFYTNEEFEVMKNDIEMAKSLGVDGVVFGILNRDGTIDMERNRELIEISKPMSTTFHRAFDTSADPFLALENIISLGFERVLTSGQKNRAVDSVKMIKKLTEVAGERLTILPGSGLREHNIEKFIDETKSKEIHMTAFKEESTGMDFKSNIPMSGYPRDEFKRKVTDRDLVRRVRKIMDNISDCR
ncbi:MAG: copper homeostasis protein CutC [Candidatus Cloacimonadota bacterium]|nr:MAG: copper homeostasis protein CutC [Candidatus Cloacimonadota bacterium]PIE81634.1 MAG: copper homeostasis protein CutC [Candidatus Delongbacteria bacterium]